MRGKYERINKAGISSLQSRILATLSDNVERPKTLEQIRIQLKIDDTPSNTVSLTRSLIRLRERSLIRSLGRNSKRENLWIRENGNLN